MATTPTTAAVSHVGKIRASNQDSGYLGRHLYLVADGMGGHAGGDVASAIAAQRVAEADQGYASPEEAVEALQSALIAANGLLAETVFEHNELTGMGTTVSALVRVGDRLALAHIGDSRVYRFREGELEQITTDHTFVQRLVESGRITPEEAAVHPRRAVLMRVLGDVDASPEIDTAVLDIRPGDRWMLCSDGLSGYVSDEKIVQILGTIRTAQGAADRLVKESLDHGAPDNVTVLLIDIDDSEGASGAAPVFVGSAAQPLSFGQEEVARRPIRLPTLLLHPLKASAPDDAHFEPESESYLDELIEEDRRRAIRRRVLWAVGVGLAAAAIVLAGYLGYRWTQMHYFVGVSEGNVAIFQGVQQSIGPISLSRVYQTTSIAVDDLPLYQQEAVENTISADSLRDAHEIVDRLSAAAGD
ncbi:PP2C family protein-serine/threonine phosphatase [Protaetiibacter intestinalis]|uniref:Serine/threonine-protein phosphatase n=1 Tax=Protaetiibacter intestinalis TaxID=2419774 RepID=A0A387B2R8_9MICO|nr:PP2C family serine/threonine-protein phosphatase [Protaetiibacter intestinalis]AYF97854.1 serine/threonine-protein phosphatase [Protaetiibacter intestinalis]